METRTHTRTLTRVYVIAAWNKISGFGLNFLTARNIAENLFWEGIELFGRYKIFVSFTLYSVQAK